MNATATPDRARKMQASKVAHSYTGWLRDAGADIVVKDDPENWLSDKKTAEADAFPPSNDTRGDQRQASGDRAKAPIARAAANIAKAPEKMIPPDEWPDNLDMLRNHIEQGSPLPGTNYGGKPLLPSGSNDARYMLVLDLPDAEDMQRGELLSGQAAALTGNMMRAAGVPQDSQFVTALALTRPASGDLPDADMAMLAAFIRHQITLMAPERLILFGSSVSSALFGAELMEKRGNLHYFNHNDQNVAALTTFHPRTLLARPQLKAQAWKDLRVLQ